MVSELASIAERLKRCLRLLGSINDGEVIAAARALIRTLKSAGLDVHALADSIGTNTVNGKLFTEAETLEIYQRGVADGRQAAEREAPMTFHNVAHEDPTWHEIACECARHPDRLHSDREENFVNDMVRRTVRGGKLTEKQADWLRSIYARVRR
jgi:hypothetical protein